MKYTLRRPCVRCPFRSDVRPFIRAERAHEILTNKAEFACHETVDYSAGDGDGQVTDDSQHCAGVLIILEHEERPHQMMRIVERLGLYDPRALDMNAPVYTSIRTAVSAHRRAR